MYFSDMSLQVMSNFTILILLAYNVPNKVMHFSQNMLSHRGTLVKIQRKFINNFAQFYWI